jgi:hypothetical protein
MRKYDENRTPLPLVLVKAPKKRKYYIKSQKHWLYFRFSVEPFKKMVELDNVFDANHSGIPINSALFNSSLLNVQKTTISNPSLNLEKRNPNV